ncbi:MAG: 50S ribosomal protein L21 [Candidatus Saccharimonadales bacterium]
MKKAVITTGGHQYIVAEGDTIDVDLLQNDSKKLEFEALLVIDGDKTTVGAPTVKDSKVTAEVVEADFKAEKVVAIRYKPKKRVRKIRGHRQHHSRIKITKIV